MFIRILECEHTPDCDALRHCDTRLAYEDRRTRPLYTGPAMLARAR
jgi:hypothetical protein